MRATRWVEVDPFDFGAAQRKELRERRANREGRTGRVESTRRATQSLPSGQSVAWCEVARTALTLAAFFGLVAGLVVIHGGKAAIRKYGRKR